MSAGTGSGSRLSFRRVVALIWAGGLIWQIVYVTMIRPRFTHSGDADYYLDGARRLASGLGFTKLDTQFMVGSLEAADHPPAYIVLLALGRLMGVASARGAVLLSCVVGSVQIPLLACAGRMLGGRRVGVIAASIAAVYVNIWVWNTVLLSEPVALVFISAFACAVIGYDRRGSLWWMAAAGTCLGLVAFARAEILVGVLALPLLALRKAEGGVRRVAAATAVGVAAMLGVLAPWVAYNFSRFDEPVLVSAGLGTAVVQSYCERAFGGPLVGYMDFSCFDRTTVLYRSDQDDSTRDRVGREVARNWLSGRESRLPGVMVARVARSLGWFRPHQQVAIDRSVELRGPGWVMWLGAVQFQILFPLGVAGMVFGWRAGRPVLPFIAIAASSVLAVAIAFGSTRYRASFEPIIVLFAALSLATLVRTINAHRIDGQVEEAA